MPLGAPYLNKKRHFLLLVLFGHENVNIFYAIAKFVLFSKNEKLTLNGSYESIELLAPLTAPNISTEAA